MGRRGWGLNCSPFLLPSPFLSSLLPLASIRKTESLMCPGEFGDIELDQTLGMASKNQECRVEPSLPIPSPTPASPSTALCILSWLLHIPSATPSPLHPSWIPDPHAGANQCMNGWLEKPQPSWGQEQSWVELFPSPSCCSQEARGSQCSPGSHLQEDFGPSHFPVFVCPQAQFSNAQSHLAVLVLKLLGKPGVAGDFGEGQGPPPGLFKQESPYIKASQQRLSDYAHALAYIPG